ncbi:MAG: hypothetical protein PHX05_00020 [Acidobacteriota bacterium]|nr:hypothetical protein [Acidobacteriota bacterium]
MSKEDPLGRRLEEKEGKVRERRREMRGVVSSHEGFVAELVVRLLGVRWALKKCRVTGDSLFKRIKEDLERGLVREARTHLNFVDELLKKEGAK